MTNFKSPFTRHCLWTSFGSLALLISFASCSGGTEKVTPYNSDATADDDDDDDYVANLYAYASSTTVAVGSYTYIYAQGGVSPYTYSVMQGDASINSSSGYLQVLSQGTVTVKVQDASGGTYQVQVEVEGETTTGSPCVYLGAKTQQVTGATESRIDLPTHAQLGEHVVVGLGARLDADSLVGIYAKVAKLNADGSISTTSVFNYQTGSLTTTAPKGEIYINLPAGYYLTGVGIAANEKGDNLEALKLFGAKVNESGNVGGTVECLVDKDVQQCSVSSISMVAKTYYTNRYNEYRSAHNKPIVTWGLTLASSKVTSSDIATKTITASTTDSGSCPQ